MAVPRRVMPPVVPVVGRRRMLVPGRVVPRVVVVGVRPVVMAMTLHHGLAGMDAAVVETQRVPLADAMPGRHGRLRGRDAALAGARPAATPRIRGAALRRSGATMIAR